MEMHWHLCKLLQSKYQGRINLGIHSVPPTRWQLKWKFTKYLPHQHMATTTKIKKNNATVYSWIPLGFHAKFDICWLTLMSRAQIKRTAPPALIFGRGDTRIHCIHYISFGDKKKRRSLALAWGESLGNRSMDHSAPVPQPPPPTPSPPPPPSPPPTPPPLLCEKSSILIFKISSLLKSGQFENAGWSDRGASIRCYERFTGFTSLDGCGTRQKPEASRETWANFRNWKLKTWNLKSNIERGFGHWLSQNCSQEFDEILIISDKVDGRAKTFLISELKRKKMIWFWLEFVQCTVRPSLWTIY